MDKTAKWHGGGTEGEEYMKASVKVVIPEKKWWRHFAGNKVFTDIQEAINSLAT